MKSFKFYISILVAAAFFASCSNEGGGHMNFTVVATFESAELPPVGFLNDTSYTEHIAKFCNEYDAGYDYWHGFAVSSCTDIVTTGPENQYSVYASSAAAGSKKFGVCYYDGMEPSQITFAVASDMKSICVNNSTYSVLAMRNGTPYSKKFESGDWFLLTITGYDGDVLRGSVDFYLADFRSGKSYICTDWTTVDLSSLSNVNKLCFTISSSDMTDTWINTPTYVCIDNLMYKYSIDY